MVPPPADPFHGAGLPAACRRGSARVWSSRRREWHAGPHESVGGAGGARGAPGPHGQRPLGLRGPAPLRPDRAGRAQAVPLAPQRGRSRDGIRGGRPALLPSRRLSTHALGDRRSDARSGRGGQPVGLRDRHGAARRRSDGESEGTDRFQPAQPAGATGRGVRFQPVRASADAAAALRASAHRGGRGDGRHLSRGDEGSPGACSS